MELELKMQELECCEKAQRVLISHEESMETAIPEYCPDMARIVDAVGQLKIREKKFSGGRLTVAGTVKVTVLYTSEESAGLRSLILPVPFTCTVDDQRLQGCRSICASGRLQLVEARAITARKLYVRVIPEFEVEAICPARYTVCCDTASEPSLHMQRKEMEVQLLSDGLERTFNFNQEFMPEPGHGVPEDLLLDRVHLRITGCQRLSSKLVIKGEACVTALYRTEGQELFSCDTVLPFSQIIDAAELPEDAVYHADAWAEESDVRLVRTDGGAGFGVAMRIGVMVRIYEKRVLNYINDLYSTKYDTVLQHHRQSVAGAQPPQTWRQEVVQQLEFGQGRPFACVTGLECSSVSILPEGDRTTLQANLRVKLLYSDESGTPISTERTMEVSVQLPYLPDHARAACAPVIMNLGSNSCELRIPVDFFTDQTEKRRLDTLASVHLQELTEKEQPALVLRRIEEGESIWDLAKAYRTDPALVESANGIEPGAPLPAGMLLIPKVRG